MLVLTRKLGEDIVIGDGIVVTVLQVSPGRVRLGITAPPQVPVHRREVADVPRVAVHGGPEAVAGRK